MKALPLLLFALFYHTGLFAQKKKVVTVKAGSNIMDVLPAKEVFHFPQFTYGKVFFKDGARSEGNMNYNRLVDEMHFINKNGDTLALSNETNIKYVVIGNDTFYYDGGYVRLLAAGNPAKLAVKQTWIISDSRVLGAYNSTNTSVGVTSFVSYNEGGRLYDLVVNEDLILTKAENYWIGNDYNHFVAAGKKNLLLLFPKEQRRLEIFLKKNKINFDDKYDLEKVVRFLTHP